MNAVKEDVEKLVQKELEFTKQKFEESFHSYHEGYSIVLEEVDEARNELQEIDFKMGGFWRAVKENDIYAKECAKAISHRAINLACEAIQVAAMAQKFIDSQKEREKSEGN